jgi:hypothetical protein
VAQILSVGGKDIDGKGWTVKGGGGAAVEYVSPNGKVFESAQAVLKHQGLLGISREDASANATLYRQQHPVPFTIKVQQGQLKVKELGNLMVEKVPRTCHKHTGTCI